MVCAEGTTRRNPSEPCPWPADTSCDPCWDDHPQEVKDRAITLATSLLWRLSGRQFGCCCITVRPCGTDCANWASTYAGWSGVGLTGMGNGQDILRPAIIDGKWVNCGYPCGDCCGPDCITTLPVGPVCDVQEVLVDGVALDPDEYQVLNGRHLQRLPKLHVFTEDDFGAETFVPGVFEFSTLSASYLFINNQSNLIFGQGVVSEVTGVKGDQITVELIENTVVTFPEGWTATTTDGVDLSMPGVMDATGLGPGLFRVVLTLDGQDGELEVTAGFPDLASIVGMRHEEMSDDCWPTCNDWDKDITEPGTWAVTYSWGSPIPTDGEYVTGILASEFAKACVGDNTCQLPRRVQNISRQGVSVQFVDDANYLTEGLTGLGEVDQWLRSVNPYGLRQRSRVYNPQSIGKHQRVTWKAP